MSETNAAPNVNGPPRDAAGDTRSTAAGITSRVKEKVSELGESVGDALHAGRLSTASGLDGAAKGLHARADSMGSTGHDASDALSRVGHDAADKVEATAKYVRSHGAKEIMSDVEEFVKGNPGKSLVAAVAVGFLVGRAFRSDR